LPPRYLQKSGFSQIQVHDSPPGPFSHDPTTAHVQRAMSSGSRTDAKRTRYDRTYDHTCIYSAHLPRILSERGRLLLGCSSAHHYPYSSPSSTCLSYYRGRPKMELSTYRSFGNVSRRTLRCSDSLNTLGYWLHIYRLRMIAGILFFFFLICSLRVSMRTVKCPRIVLSATRGLMPYKISWALRLQDWRTRLGSQPCEHQ
jgi:hypothetical protein